MLSSVLASMLCYIKIQPNTTMNKQHSIQKEKQKQHNTTQHTDIERSMKFEKLRVPNA